MEPKEVIGGVEKTPFFVDKKPDPKIFENSQRNRLEKIQEARKQKKLEAQSKLFPDKKKKKKEPVKRGNVPINGKKKKRITKVNKSDHILPPPKINLDLWGSEDHNKFASKKKRKKKIGVRKIHPGQSYNPEKNDFFNAYKELQEQSTNQKKKRFHKKKNTKKKKVKKSIGDDVLEGLFASEGKYANKYSRDDDLEPPLPPASVIREKKRKKKKKEYGKKRYSTLEQKQQPHGKKLTPKEMSTLTAQQLKDVPKVIEAVDSTILQEKVALKKKRSKKRKRIDFEKSFVDESILGKNDLDVSIYHSQKSGRPVTMQRAIGGGNKRLFGDLVKKHKEVNMIPKKRRKLYHNP